MGTLKGNKEALIQCGELIQSELKKPSKALLYFEQAYEK